MKDKQLSLKQNILWNSIGCFIYQACMWLMTILVVTLSHGYDNSGILAYAMAIGNIYYPLATYNMRTIQVSDVNDDHSSNTYVGFRVFTVIAAYFAIAIYLGITTASMELIVATLIWLFFKADESFCAVYYGIDQRAMRMDLIGISQAARGVLSLAAFSLCLILTGNICLAMASVFVICMLITIFFDRKVASWFASTFPKIAFRNAILMLKKYWLAALTLVCYGAIVSVARQYFESMHGAEMLGIYAAVATPSVIIQVAASYMYSPMIGRISETWNSGSAKDFVLLMGKIMGAIVIVEAVIIAAGALVGSPLLVLVFGQSITDYTYLFVPALVAASVTTLFAFSFDSLIAIRNLKGAFLSNVVALVICALATPALISAFYMNGVNVAIIVCYGAGLLLCAFSFMYSLRTKKRQSKQLTKDRA